MFSGGAATTWGIVLGIVDENMGAILAVQWPGVVWRYWVL